jgi:hypothetical protein
MAAYKRVVDNLSIRLSILVGMILGLVCGHLLTWMWGFVVLIGFTGYLAYTTWREHLIEKVHFHETKQLLIGFSRDKNAV